MRHFLVFWVGGPYYSIIVAGEVQPQIFYVLPEGFSDRSMIQLSDTGCG
jgi:hypothetical protein